MGYPTDAIDVTRFGCNNISMVGAGGQGVLFTQSYQLSVLSVPKLSKIIVMLCVYVECRNVSISLYQLDVMVLKLIRVILSEKWFRR
jgi:hypothetical protein